MPLVTETDTTRWQNAIAKGRHLTATCVEGAGSDHQEWDVVSNSDPSRRYQVALHFSARGTEAGCTCDAARFDDVCCHVAGVLLRTGHVHWFERIVARRDRVHGQIKLIDADGGWQFLSQFDPAEWGAASAGYDRRITAQHLLEQLHRSPRLNPALCDWLTQQPWEGWEITTVALHAHLSRCESLSVVGSAA